MSKVICLERWRVAKALEKLNEALNTMRREHGKPDIHLARPIIYGTDTICSERHPLLHGVQEDQSEDMEII